MYERFTDRARKVMQLANQEAQRFGHDTVGVECLIVGLAKEGNGVAANVLRNLKIDLRKIREEIEKSLPLGNTEDTVTMGRLPHTPELKRVVQYANDEAIALNHNYVGTEHLLLGSLKHDEEVSGNSLIGRLVKAETVREEVKRLLKGTASDEPAMVKAERDRLLHTLQAIRLLLSTVDSKFTWTLTTSAPELTQPNEINEDK